MRIFLGSASPRRKELLASMGFEFEVVKSDIDENYPSHLQKEAIAAHIAHEKSKSLSRFLQSSSDLLICADTIVCLENDVLGKPSNATEAAEMLNRLSGKTHEVFTGVCVTTISKTVQFSERTFVTFKRLRQEEINYYIENYQPFDKAGSYGVQDWFGMMAVEKLDGSYTNVMGLPTLQLGTVLFEQFQLSAIQNSGKK
jgi:septum formation protein